VGQRVVLNPWLSCAPRGVSPVCEMCEEGQYSLCINFKRGRLAPGIHTGVCAIEILKKLFDAKIYAITRFERQAELARRLGAIETIPWRPAEKIVERFAAITGAREILPPIEGTDGLPMLHGARGVRVVYNTVGTPESFAVAIRIAGPRSTVVISGVDT